MNKKHIDRLKDILSEWNPLGDMANQISDLENYEIEATDILFHINKKNSVEQISKIIKTVLEQAFDIDVNKEKSLEVAHKIHLMINEK
ncbi:DUF1871 family protein [Flavobacterium sp. ASW18X]|uniref:DUF1871 family protein n=1 Tax=Flavobacterium sp. ASW18X TaxID=2572595 RepID=UPI0010ADBBDD|nr:DUF1871 family protein [Flavobacterium sp. ASW18X]TKD60646.1 DUF1871 family protein [Flavobacterium sp. ASW18X]